MNRRQFFGVVAGAGVAATVAQPEAAGLTPEQIAYGAGAAPAKNRIWGLAPNGRMALFLPASPYRARIRDKGHDKQVFVWGDDGQMYQTYGPAEISVERS